MIFKTNLNLNGEIRQEKWQKTRTERRLEMRMNNRTSEQKKQTSEGRKDEKDGRKRKNITDEVVHV